MTDSESGGDHETTALLRRTQEEENELKAAEATGPEGGSDSGEGEDGLPPSHPEDGRNIPDADESDTDSEDEGLASTRLRQEQIRLDNLQQNTWLRKVLAYAAVGMVSLQLLMSNLFFAYFLAHNVDEPDPKIMIAWLTSSVVEVIGILLVVARSLFKGRKKTSNPTS